MAPCALDAAVIIGHLHLTSKQGNLIGIRFTNAFASSTRVRVVVTMVLHWFAGNYEARARF
jgi:hypothetical protein